MAFINAEHQAVSSLGVRTEAAQREPPLNERMVIIACELLDADVALGQVECRDLHIVLIM